jgi:hypothetical protein
MLEPQEEILFSEEKKEKEFNLPGMVHIPLLLKQENTLENIIILLSKEERYILGQLLLG